MIPKAGSAAFDDPEKCADIKITPAIMFPLRTGVSILNSIKKNYTRHVNKLTI